MQVVKSILTTPLGLERPVVTMGTFDGLHRGHVAIVERLLALSRESDTSAVAVTFDPHPQRVLAADDRAPKLLSTLEERLDRFAALKVDCVVVIPFDREFSRWSADRYINELVLGRLGAGYLVVGYDHAFGHDRQRFVQCQARGFDSVVTEVGKRQRGRSGIDHTDGTVCVVIERFGDVREWTQCDQVVLIRFGLSDPDQYLDGIL